MVAKCRAASLAGHCTANRGLKQVISRQEIHQLFGIDVSQTPAPAPSDVASGSFPHAFNTLGMFAHHDVQCMHCHPISPVLSSSSCRYRSAIK